jgi:hypothetical protein
VLGYQLLQVVYWLALSTWLGGGLFIALAAPVIFRVMREARPILPQVLAVNLNHQHDTLLAGTVVSEILGALARVQYLCAGLLAATMGLQTLVISFSGSNATAAAVRAVLLVLAAGLVVYDRRVLWPQLKVQRQTYIDHADEPETANPAKDAFDQLQQRSLTVMLAVLSLLVGLVLFSANISPKAAETPGQISVPAVLP